jgi:hypothetical protein
MPRVPRASIAEAPAGIGETTAAATSAGPLEAETRDWYDADAVTFAAAAATEVPARIRAWPPESRVLETHVRALVVAAQSGRR